MSDDDLFKDRVPEAVARQLAVVLAWATECQLATVERLALRVRPPVGELRRHRSIAEQLVFHCRDLGVEPRGLMGRECGRLRDAMAEQEARKP